MLEATRFVYRTKNHSESVLYYRPNRRKICNRLEKPPLEIIIKKVAPIKMMYSFKSPRHCLLALTLFPKSWLIFPLNASRVCRITVQHEPRTAKNEETISKTNFPRNSTKLDPPWKIRTSSTMSSQVPKTSWKNNSSIRILFLLEKKIAPFRIWVLINVPKRRENNHSNLFLFARFDRGSRTLWKNNSKLLVYGFHSTFQKRREKTIRTFSCSRFDRRVPSVLGSARVAREGRRGAPRIADRRDRRATEPSAALNRTGGPLSRGLPRRWVHTVYAWSMARNFWSLLAAPGGGQGRSPLIASAG